MSAEEAAEFKEASHSIPGPPIEGVRQKMTDAERAEHAAAVAAEKPPAATGGDEPSTMRAIAEGGLQGGSYGFGDEFQGVLGATMRRDPIMNALGYSPEAMGEENIFSPSGYGGTFMEDYRSERDAARRDRENAEKAHPTAFNASQLAAAILAPGPKGGKTVGSFVKAGAKGGGLYALGSSGADLTKGDVGEAAADTAVGTGLGVLGGAVAGVANKPVQAIARKLDDVGAKAWQRGSELAQKPIDKAINSARGSLGGEISAGSNALEKLRAAASDPSLPEDVSRGAADLLAKEEAKALNERVARGAMGQFDQRIPRIDNAQDAFETALKRGTPESRAAATDALMDKSPMRRALWEITKRIGPTLAGASLGGHFGGAAGAGVGGTLGVLTGAMSGAPGRIVKNAASSPQFQRSAAQLGTRGLEEALPGAMQGMTAEQSGNTESLSRSELLPYLKLLAGEGNDNEHR